MIFRTELRLPPSQFKISHKDEILLMGSCFSVNIGDKLKKYKFTSSSNPFGTVFHPVALTTILDRVFDNIEIDYDDLILSQGVWVHSDFPRLLSGIDRATTVEKINLELDYWHKKVDKIDYLFLTLGTSIGYIYNKTNRLVASCHKMPQSSFTKVESEIPEMQESLENCLRKWQNRNKKLKAIITVSPVRHTREGMVENSRSKARLITLAENLCKRNDFISYFPAYEVMMDDLRDYRFYDKDMIHPNEVAVDYIWDVFSYHYFSDETLAVNREIEKIISGLEHRPIHPESLENKAFQENLKKKIDEMEMKHPGLKF